MSAIGICRKQQIGHWLSLQLVWSSQQVSHTRWQASFECVVIAAELKTTCLLAEDWIKQPLVDVSRIKERYNVVEALNTADQCREELHRNMMRQIPDVAMLSRKLSQSRATLEVSHISNK